MLGKHAPHSLILNGLKFELRREKDNIALRSTA